MNFKLFVESKKEPDFKTLKKNKVELTEEERKKVFDAKATWNNGIKGKPTSAVWKSKINDEIWYITNTHRAYNVSKTLDGIINRYHKFIKTTA